jgi:hypothetical protein
VTSDPRALLADTERFVARLRGVLAMGEATGAPPVHLTFSDIPARLDAASRLLGAAAAGDAAAQAELARWMARVRDLDAPLEALHTAGALGRGVLEACRRLVAEHGPLVEGWTAWSADRPTPAAEPGVPAAERRGQAGGGEVAW